MEEESKNNRIYKLISAKYALTQEELVEVFELGGLEVSKSAAHGMHQRLDNRKYRVTHEDEIRAFFKGLPYFLVKYNL